MKHSHQFKWKLLLTLTVFFILLHMLYKSYAILCILGETFDGLN